MSDKIAIVLATYNGERFLREQLDSYLTQTVLPDELVVSDDGSSDATIGLLQEYAKDAPFEVRILQGERLGFAQNFGRAMAATTGKVIFLSDQDDAWEPHKIERVLEVDAPLVVHDLMLCDAALHSSGQTMSERMRLFGMAPDQNIKGCCSAIRRELLDIVLPIPENIAHDVFIHALGRATGWRTYIPDVLVRYRIHEENTSDFALNSLAPVTPWLRAKMSARARLRGLRSQTPPRPPMGAFTSQRLAERGVMPAKIDRTEQRSTAAD
jgi:glycosyltransferase involved in cell wall biosynthesis